MAAALLDRAANGKLHIRSAGSTPGDEIHPGVRQVMAEIEMDMSDTTPTALSDELLRTADVIVTMGCGDSCPVYPGKRYVDWEVEDPAGKPVEQVRPIRDEIDRRVRALLAELVPAS
jgi:protein-tyrosine-phosphatase